MDCVRHVATKKHGSSLPHQIGTIQRQVLHTSLSAFVEVLCRNWINFIVAISVITHCLIFPAATSSRVVLSGVKHLLDVFLSFLHIVLLPNNENIWITTSVLDVITRNVHGNFEAVLDVSHL